MKAAIPNTAQEQWLPLAAGRKKKLPRLKPRDRLDALIDWYEKNMPDHEKVLPGGVTMEKRSLDRFASTVKEGVWMYRGWTLTRVEPISKKTRIRK